MTASLGYWVADWNLSRAEASLLLGGHAQDMIDCTSSSAGAAGLKESSCRRFAIYVTGTPDIRWTRAQVEQLLPAGARVLRVDQSNLDLELHADAKVAKDVESGASQIDTAVKVAGQRLHHDQDYVIYVDRAELQALEAAVARAGLPAGEIIGYQYASPTSNPDTLVPGTQRTLKDANVDLSVVRRTFLAPAAAVHEGRHVNGAHVQAVDPSRGPAGYHVHHEGRREHDPDAPDRYEPVGLEFNPRTAHWRIR